MAKKHRNIFLNIDNNLQILFESGFLHSLIINSLILLIMGLITYRATTIEPLVIQVSELSNVEINDSMIDIIPKELEILNTDNDSDNVNIVIDDKNDITKIDIDSEIVYESKDESVSVIDDINDYINTDIIQSNKNNNAGEPRSAGNTDSDLENRLSSAGAKTGDIQVSIAWDNLNDIDVWVVLENKLGSFTINWMNRIGPNNGNLDIDMNVYPISNTPIENIYWPHGCAPEGKYTVYINHYQQWETYQHTTNVKIRILYDGKIFHKRVPISRYEGIKKIFTFYHKVSEKKDVYSSSSTGPHLPIGQLLSAQ